MSSPVVVVDYGVGNLLSVTRALEHCGAAPQISSDPDAVRRAERLVLPGVGAFEACMASLKASRLDEPVLEFIASGRPLFGICVGMQMLLEVGEEFGLHHGLGVIKGRVSRIPDKDSGGAKLKIPHIGWSELRPRKGTNDRDWCGTVMQDVMPGMAAYFVHSFAAVPTDPSATLAVTSYGGQPITAAIAQGNVIGTQFHPEKSGAVGINILRRFVDDH
jgi:imidazole glycerol-phosphate synthase subunit HisH